MSSLDQLEMYHYRRWEAIINLQGAKRDYAKGDEQGMYEALLEWAMAMYDADYLYSYIIPHQSRLMIELRAWD